MLTSNHAIKSAFEGFEGIKRFFDRKHNIVAARILPGQYYVSNNNEMITTVLGSCISACVFDRINKIGGMNHFMLPHLESNKSIKVTCTSAEARYGNFAMEHMINDILKHGGVKKNFEVKVFGGAKIIYQSTADIGNTNINFVLDYLKLENLKLVSKDVGDIYPRKINFIPGTGKVFVKHLSSLNNNTIREREKGYMKRLEKEKIEGDIELF